MVNRLPDLPDLELAELLQLHAGILKELRTRGIARSNNSPVGDYAEHLFCTTMGWDIQNNSFKGVDATGPDGTRYQIKSRRITTKSSTHRLGVLRDLEAGEFDFLAVALFDENYNLVQALLLPHGLVLAQSSYNKHSNGHIFHIRRTSCVGEGVQDITARFIPTSK